MKLLLIICEASVEDRICAIVEQAGAPGYTRFTGAQGHGPSGRREGTAVWPGLNSIVMCAVPDELVSAITVGIDSLTAERNGRLAVKVFSVPTESLC